MAKTTQALVNAFEAADMDVSEHYAICPDQEERGDCRACRELNRARSEARRAMSADPASAELRNRPAQVEKRRLASRTFLQNFYSDEYAHHGEY